MTILTTGIAIQKSSALKRSLPLGYSVLRQELETEVGESLVGFGHLVRVVLLADSVAFTVLGSNEFGSKAVGHVGFVAVAGGIEEPAEGESLGAVRGDFHRNLVVRTTDAAGLDFDARLDVFEAEFELLESVSLPSSFLSSSSRAV